MRAINLTTFILSTGKTVGLTPMGVEYVLRVISSPPSRNVTNVTKRNILVDYPSTKMECSIEFESVNPEAAQGMVCERDPLCLGYWAQPEPVAVQTTLPDGSTRTVWRTPDILAVYADRVVLYECKPEEKLEELSKKSPKLYARNADGRWHSPEWDAALAPYGIKFVVVSTDDLPTNLIRNISVLAEVFGHKPTSDSTIDSVKGAIPAGPDGITLSELIDKGGDAFGRNDVFYALLKGHIFTQLDVCLLRDARTTRVFSTQAKCEGYRLAHFPPRKAEITPLAFVPGTKFAWQNAQYHVCSVGPDSLYVQHDNADPQRISKTLLTTLAKEGEARILDIELPSETTNSELIKRWQYSDDPDVWRKGSAKAAFLAVLDRNPTTDPSDFGLKKPSPRTMQRWKDEARDGVARFGSAIWGLIGKIRPGRPRSDLPEAIREEMRVVADQHYFSLERKKARWCWRALRSRLEAKNLHCPSYKSFCRFLARQKNLYDSTLAREDVRAAYPFGSVAQGESRNWINGDDFPGKVAQMDGKLLDIVVVDDETGEVLGRPGITVITLPKHGNAPIGISVVFEKPSYRSATLAVRDMFERGLEIPSYLIVDNGKEFNNCTFDRLLASLKITKVRRPPSCPRFSAQIESFFRSLDQELIHNLAGNTQPLSEVRQMTQMTNPETRAVWTLSRFWAVLQKYLFEMVWDAPAAGLGTTPRAAIERDRAHAPDRSCRFILPPEVTKVAFFPDVEGGTRVVQPGRGVFVDGYYYWHDKMRESTVERSKVRVRYNPQELYIAYADIGGEWRECKALNAPELRNATESTRQMQMLAKRRLRSTHAARREDTHGRKLGALAAEVQNDESVLREERRRRAEKQIDKSTPAVTEGTTLATPVAKTTKMDFRHLRYKQAA